MLHRIYKVLVIAGLMLFATATAEAQRVETRPRTPQQEPARPREGPNIYGGYMIGVGDIIDVRVSNEESLTGRYQVDQSGEIHLPLLSQPIAAAGSTTFALAGKLRDELKKQDILKDPAVTVFIERGMSQNVTLLGAVARPGVYPVEKPTAVLEALSFAGGLQPNAGSTLTITRGERPGIPGSGEASGVNAQPEEKTVVVDLNALATGKEPAANELVQAGDVITVSTAPIVFVVGAVMRPGAFTVPDAQGGMTVLQAVALAEGATPVASLGKAVVVRQSSNDSERQEIAVKLDDVMEGKATDVVLQANDILFIPESGFKKGFRRITDVAVGMAQQAAGYGLGVRIGRP